MRAPYTCILFDLDGTIADSAPGIIGSLRLALADLGREEPALDLLKGFIGPPIQDSFQFLFGMDEAEIAEAIEVYRKHYRAGGVLEATAYEGVPELIAELHAAGYPIALATSKPESSARVVLDHFGLTPYFIEVCGASEDETRSHKADVVEEAIRRMTADGVDLSRPLMIGDRSHDVLGAGEHGIPTVRVRWGYGGEGESSGALATVDTVEELRALILAGVDAEAGPTANRPSASNPAASPAGTNPAVTEPAEA